MRSTPVLLTSVNADANGDVHATVTIPMSASFGEHNIVLVGDGADGSPTEVLLPTDVMPFELPATGGGDRSATILLASLMLAAGVLCVTRTRRRL